MGINGSTPNFKNNICKLGVQFETHYGWTTFKHKVRIIACIFEQKGVDFQEFFILIYEVGNNLISCIIPYQPWKLGFFHLDMKTTFLNEHPSQKVYMTQLEGFIIHIKESKICKHIIPFNGLHQALCLGT